MFYDPRFLFCLAVGSMLMVLGVMMLSLSPSGWSLFAVGLCVMTVTLLFETPKRQADSNMHALQLIDARSGQSSQPGQSA